MMGARRLSLGVVINSPASGHIVRGMPFPRSFALASVLLAWLLSCGGKAPGGTAPGPGSPQNDGGNSVFAGGDGAAGALAVSLPASLDVGCPGACVTLSPAIAGGVPPYTVRWSDGATG